MQYDVAEGLVKAASDECKCYAHRRSGARPNPHLILSMLYLSYPSPACNASARATDQFTSGNDSMPQSPSTSRTARYPSARTQSSLHDSSPPCTTCTSHITRRSHNLCRDVRIRNYCSCSCSFSNSSRGRTSIGFASPASVAADWPPVSATARKEGPAPVHECLSWLNLVGLAHASEPGARWC